MSIEENIKIGNPNASDQEFRSAMLAANATEFISEMPEKEKTPVGPRGSNLSGGQRQRIAIARAPRAPCESLSGDSVTFPRVICDGSVSSNSS